jgi:hypothetical protein
MMIFPGGNLLMSSVGFINFKIAKHKIILWLIAAIITLVSAVYQRMTGPTYPFRGTIILGGQKYSYKLLRSEVTDRNAAVQLMVIDSTISGYITYKRYRSNDDWFTQPLTREKELLTGYLPKQPAAGKIIYTVHLRKGTQEVSLTGAQPVILRFKGEVPAWVLIPHILIIFLAMLLSNRTALEALDSTGQSKKYMLWTIGFFLVGGFILGPAVQKYAFNAWWTGIPFGYDLTDNKTLIAMLGWLLAWYKNRQQFRHRGWILFATVLMLGAYLIPHSLFGSELDYNQMHGETQP